MAKSDNLTDFLTDVANAIRTKKETSGLIDPQDFSSEIDSISTIEDYSGLDAELNRLQEAVGVYPSSEELFITLSSATNMFNLSTGNASTNWDGTLEYSTNKTTWQTFDGNSIISSVNDGSKYVLYLRGTGNTVIAGSTAKRFLITSSEHDIIISGNIETLLDYATVGLGNHPPMATSCFYGLFYQNSNIADCSNLQLPATTLVNSCYRSMFEECSYLQLPPSLPATTIAQRCYQSMFRSTGIIKIPSLPATTLASYCYSNMFSGCSNIKISDTQDSTYTNAYRIPTTGEGITASAWASSMFNSTGGTYTSNPVINTTYYTSNDIV